MRWTVSPAVVWLELAGHIQLYDTGAGEFQTLNSTATAIWLRLVDRGERDAVVADLVREYGATNAEQRSRIATDTDRLIQDLADRAFILAETTPAR